MGIKWKLRGKYTIRGKTSERFEHREENRKDWLTTLYGLIEEAGKANKIPEDMRSDGILVVFPSHR
ncbi:predicted protein [Arabidopsis lyrata subsp. lyrata]|uniref:Predicted protein n=1 Tax=Arabidopsis lyrata subsp. lyrata TaxID=81972 RepID=D7L842_ARALL|nr:predicted protein [Arabidopsis lyrata subsp. lyrata]